MWHRAVFNVPSDTPIEKVIDKAPKFAKLFVEAREKEGWRLNSRVWLERVPTLLKETPDRVQYALWAWLERQPIKRVIEVPENLNLIKVLEKKYGAKIT